jgi:hypothetical protein
MINLGSIAGLYEREHELHAYCHRCDRWSVLDLDRMVRAGQESRRLPLTVRCRVCGEVGSLQVRPPMPPPSRAGWIAPPTPPCAPVVAAPVQHDSSAA